ncbi:DNA-binding response regulator [Brevibacillus reuszeri]|uniref:response regulator n=1 Tax=Brevibacillus reuszeri TaxID=54915 RepID=UPI001B293834|nr:response regulator transcription factor [Brevibacillus reuszeri]GIO08854.1 DNA-binding response regulator [Brevibacillus reuszeri]
MSVTRIFIADDHNIVREGLQLLFSTSPFQVIGEASDGESALRKILTDLPDVAVLDLNMPELDGIEVTKRIKEKAPEIKVIILTIYTEEKFLVESMLAGADGYVLKTINKDELFFGIEEVCRGKKYIDGNLMQRAFFQVIRGEQKDSVLTDRELDVLKLMARGKTNKEISSELYIGSDTVKEYVTAIMKKLDSKNRTDAVAKAIRNQIIL